MSKKCEEWALKWAEAIETGEKMLVQRDVAMDVMNQFIENTNVLKDKFNEFLGVNKRFIAKPSAKAKSKGKKDAAGASAGA